MPPGLPRFYSNPGTENLQTYSFIAASTGDLIESFAGTGAAFEQQLGVLVNGISTGLVGLNNHASVLGESFNLGHVGAASRAPESCDKMKP
jgi:hypothetical protein